MRSTLRHAVMALVLALTTVAVAPAASAQVESASAPSASLTDSNSVGAMLTRLYYAFFDRAPDAGGYAFWLDQVTNGRPIADAAEQFAVSDEFVTTYGTLTNAEFIDRIYQNVLDRAGDAGGVTFWLGELDSGNRTRGEVVLGISDSAEFRDRIEAVFPDTPVMRLYCAYYLRMPDTGGRDFWRQQYSWGLPLSEISNEFAQAAEYTERYGNVTNRDFVTAIYVNVLNRAPEAGGLSFWSTALDNDAFTRGQVMVEFSESDEYKDRFPLSGTECPEQTYVLPDASPTAANDAASVQVSQSITIDWAGNDTLVDSAALDSFDATGTLLGGAVTDNGDGTFGYAAPGTDGTDTFTYTVCDDDPTPSCSTATVTVVVNPVSDGTDPDAVNDSAAATTATAVVIDWDDNDDLVDGATLSSVDPASAQGGTVTDNGDGTFTYTSAAEFVGTDTFTYTVCDDDPVCDIATVTVSVSSGGAPAGLSCTLFFTPPKFDEGETELNNRFLFYTKFLDCYETYEAYVGNNDLVIEFSDTTIGDISVNPVPYDPIGHDVVTDNADYLPEGHNQNIVVTSTVTLYMEEDNGTPVPTRTALVTIEHVANYRISDGSGTVPEDQWIGINGTETITYHVDPTS